MTLSVFTGEGGGVGQGGRGGPGGGLGLGGMLRLFSRAFCVFSDVRQSGMVDAFSAGMRLIR